MEIRRLTTNDYDALVQLWFRAGLPFKPRGRDSRKAIASQMDATLDFFLGAFQDNRLVGVTILSCDKRKGWLNRLAVEPYFRRLGVAKFLIVKSEEILRECDVRIFYALIEDGNTASQELFKDCGYVEHRDIIYFSKRGSDEV
jgi:N-acetylglutamate synthase-like GNAT family acetyltransferase